MLAQGKPQANTGKTSNLRNCPQWPHLTLDHPPVNDLEKMTWKKSNQRPVERFHCFKMWQLDLVCFEFFHCLKQFLSVSNNGASDLDIWTTVDCLFVQFIFYCSVYLFNCLGKAGADWAARVRPQSQGQSFQGSTQRNTFENFDKKKTPPPQKKK